MACLGSARKQRRATLMVGWWVAALLAVGAAPAARAAVQVAGSLVVELDARHASAGTAVWVNTGSMGNFDRVGSPTLVTILGQPAVLFNGTGDAYRSQNPTVATIEGASDRSIELWVYNPSVDSAEETMIAWGRRGTTRANMAFNWGNSASWGAVTHYGADMGWSGAIPTPGQWHHLVYVYNGTQATVYDNTVARTTTTYSGSTALATATGQRMNLGAQNSSTGDILFVNEFNGSQMSLSGAIALVRVHSGALTPAQIAANFEEDRARFGAVVPPTPVDLLSQGYIDLDTPDFNLRLVRTSQTVAALNPKGAGTFDFTPADRLTARRANGYMHLGDVTLRVREGTAGSWVSYSTAAERYPVEALTTGGLVLARADLSPTLPPACPLRVERSWELDGNGRLVMRVVLTNRTQGPVQIGALGFPLIFNNYITGRTLEQAHEICSFSDPYIGQGAGYVQVTRLKGAGPALVVVPDGATRFEAYNPLLNEPTARSQTFEGFYEWLAHSRAFADNEWAAVEPWNPPTLATLDAGTSVSYGLKFLLAPEIRAIDAALEAAERPVTVGVPGYILPRDLEARLFLRYGAPVASLAVDPPGAIDLLDSVPIDGGRWRALTLRGAGWGRARLRITYADGLEQTVHYYVVKPMAQVVSDLGQFLFTRQWYTDVSDPFLRAPSVISYDRELDQPVLQDNRVWIAGLQDEAGAGSWVAAAMKLFGQPETAQLGQFQQFVDQVLWGRIQYATHQGGNRAPFTVRRSLFFYEPAAVPGFVYTITSGWNKADAENIWRSYNYPHVAAAHWAMYRLARNNPGLVTNRDWQWYLERAWRTGWAMAGPGVSFDQHGQMEGSVFLEILKDLRREGLTSETLAYEGRMKPRVDAWNATPYPFGSEMAWDSTGQEEVYVWCKYYGYESRAQETLNAILGYMPTVPHWGYNGNARRYWDFLYGGKIRRIERQLHHYGSGLNAIPVLQEFREHPDDFYLLRVGYGGAMGALSNIDPDGFASAAFHAWPDTLRWDPYSGDFGPNFFGHTMTIGTYIVHHPTFGWLAFGGNATVEGDRVRVAPLDSYRKRVYVAPFGLWLTLDAGTFEQVEIVPARHDVRLRLAPAGPNTPQARLRVEQPATVAGVGTFAPTQAFGTEREAYVIPLTEQPRWVTLTDRPEGQAAVAGGRWLGY